MILKLVTEDNYTYNLGVLIVLLTLPYIIYLTSTKVPMWFSMWYIVCTVLQITPILIYLGVGCR